MSDGDDVRRLATKPTMVPQDFTACYRAEKLKVVRFLINQGATEHEAHDAAQAAFLQAYRQWDTIRNPLSWLFTVARREFLAAQVPETPTDAFLASAHAPTTPSAIDLSDQAREVLATLETLPVKQRQVMALSVDEFTPAEIARHLRADPASVRQNLRKARQNLKNRLGFEGTSSDER
jgi:RNA polymerase sigma factor (sigma-70 family)